MDKQNVNFNEIGNNEFGKIRSSAYSRGDMKNVLGNMNTVETLAKSGALAKFAMDLKTLGSMVKDYVSGAYRAIPMGTIFAIVGTLAYVISPVDAIPDAIPVLGLLDDAAVVRLCLDFVHFDIDAYRQWRKNKKVSKMPPSFYFIEFALRTSPYILCARRTR